MIRPHAWAGAVLGLLLCCTCRGSAAQEGFSPAFMASVEAEVRELMDEGDVPGLSLVLVKGDRQIIRSFGYADVARRVPVTSRTAFELGSNSKAFTALAVTALEQQQKLHLDDYVSDYIPWFRVTYADTAVRITLRQLLHHTSGIPWHTLAKIPPGDAPDALERTVRQLVGQALHHLPGKEYQYATINYDVLALVIERVTGQPFEAYLQAHVIDRLQLAHTAVGKPKAGTSLATGYKISFLAPRAYAAPVFRGNYAAGYVVSTAEDVAQWLKFQLGLTGSDLYGLAQLTHQRDETVPLHAMSAYARGWNVSLAGTNEIYHGGLNPNYSSYIAMRPAKKLAIAVLTNANSNFTAFTGDRLMKLLAGDELEKDRYPGDDNDKLYSALTGVMAVYLLGAVAYAGAIVAGVRRGSRSYEPFTRAKAGRLLKVLAGMLPFGYGMYLLPRAIAGFTWEAILVWTPASFAALVAGVAAAAAVSVLVYLLGLCCPAPNEFRQRMPWIIVMSLLSGLSNVVVIIMVTSAIDSDAELKYLVFYYGLTIAVYLLGRRFVQVSLIKLTRGLVYELRMRLIEKIFSTSYQKFEQLDRGQVYTVLNDDINTLSQSTNLFVTLISSVVTAAGAFLYLASIAFWATVLTVFLIVTISAVYYWAVQKTNRYFREARSAEDAFMRLMHGMIEGFKEISLHRNKKMAYQEDVAACANEFRQKLSTANIRFVNAFLVGESLLVILLGVVSMGMAELFPTVRSYTVMRFVIVLLYLIGPVNAILSAVPVVMGFKVAWDRVQQFIAKIPANLSLNRVPEARPARVETIEARGLKFEYQKKNDHQPGFSIGPIDLEARRGEIVFIIGGNGSGKTTLAKLLTGLYQADEGVLLINGREISPADISEYFSTVFSPAHLFEKLYLIDLHDKRKALSKYLKLLHLEEKVTITGNSYSTIDLSAGQRKRLALLQCYLEDSPIYLLDEWAADQDPAYRNFFYRTLLPEMKKQGKIVIAITHDEHYFDVADKVLKMNGGRLEVHAGSIWTALETSDEGA